MPVAAVPYYLGRDFANASPGMRFTMYLPIWTSRVDQETEINGRAGKKSREAEELQEYLKSRGMDATIAAWTERERNRLPNLWAKNDDAGRLAWREVARIGKRDKDLISALVNRQEALATVHQDVGALVTFEAQAIAPFTTGLGNEHPLENGFAFLSPYGLPYLPGTGVKGVLRQAARELVSGQWGDTADWSTEKCYKFRVGREAVFLSQLEILFGLQSGDSDSEHVRGVLSFWDVIPQIEGESLMVEIMTPHQGHYYQWKKDRNSNEIEVSPHESGQPTPISFLTVPPRSRFTFYVKCDLGRLSQIAPDLAQDRRWQELLRPLFEHAFAWCGFGAKTAVGYGVMDFDSTAENQRQARIQEREQARARERELQAAIAGLPEDAAWIVERTRSGGWPEGDNSAFLADVEAYMAGRETLSSEGYVSFKEQMELRWQGIMANPDALEGKKQKPKFKDRPKALAKRLIELKSTGKQA
jgi:CRISPR-associated protein Cmr6